MAFGDIGSLGAAGSTAADQATLVLTTTATAVVGSLIAVVIASDNRGSVDTDDESVSGVVDSAGNTYRKAQGYANAQTGAQLGAAVSMWYAEVTTQLDSGDTITASFTTATSVDAAGMTAHNFSYAGGTVVEVEATNWGVTDAGDPAALTATTANIECLRIRGIAGEVGNNTSLTPTASWTAWENGNSATTGTTAEMCARAEHIISTTTSASSNPTWVSCDNASVYVAFKEVTPIAATDIDVIDVSTEASVASGFTLVCNAPAVTPATDDILVVISGAARGDAVHSMDAAWTREVEISGSTSFSSLSVFWMRYAGSIPDRTITYTLTSLAKIAAMAIIRGCKTSGSPFNQVGADVQGTDNSLEHTGFTTTVDKCLLALINSTDDVSVNDSRVLVDGFTNILEDSGGGTQNCMTTGSFDTSISMMIKDQGPQGLVTTKTVHGGNIGGWSAVMLAFEPEPGAGGTETPKTVTVASATTVNAIKSAGKLVAIARSTATSFLKQIGKRVTVASATSTNFRKALTKTVNVASTGAVSVIKRANKTVSLISTSASSISKTIGKRITITSASTIALDLLKALSKTINITSAGSVSIIKNVGKRINATSVTSVTLDAIRVFLKAINITSNLTVSLSRSILKQVNVLSASTVAVIKAIAKHVNVTSTGTVSVRKAITKAINLSIVTIVVVSALKLVLQTINISVSTIVTLRKSIPRIITMNVASSISVLKQIAKKINLTAIISTILGAIPSATTFLKTISMNISTSVTLRKAISKQLNITLNGLVAVRKGMAVVLNVLVSTSLNIIKSAQVTVLEISRRILYAFERLRALFVTENPRVIETTQEIRVIFTQSEERVIQTVKEDRVIFVRPEENVIVTEGP